MKKFLIILLVGALFSCSSIPKNVAEYEEWFKDESNGFVKKKSIGNIYVLVQERPADLMALIQLREKSKIEKSQIDSLLSEFEGASYFIMEIGFKTETDGKDIVADRTPTTYDKYAELINELSFGLEKNVEVCFDNDTIKPVLYNYERGYELGKKERFIFVFPKIVGAKKQFIYYDEIFGLGICKFEFDERKDYPKLEKEIFNN